MRLAFDGPNRKVRRWAAVTGKIVIDITDDDGSISIFMDEALAEMLANALHCDAHHDEPEPKAT